MNGHLTDPELLDDLARCPSEILRLEAALNKHSRPETLIELIDDDDTLVREAALVRLLEPQLLSRLSPLLRQRLIDRLLNPRRSARSRGALQTAA